jgi:hypothetical protein
MLNQRARDHVRSRGAPAAIFADRPAILHFRYGIFPQRRFADDRLTKGFALYRRQGSRKGGLVPRFGLESRSKTASEHELPRLPTETAGHGGSIFLASEGPVRSGKPSLPKPGMSGTVDHSVFVRIGAYAPITATSRSVRVSRVRAIFILIRIGDLAPTNT